MGDSPWGLGEKEGARHRRQGVSAAQMELSERRADGCPTQSLSQMLVDERQKDMLLLIPCDLFVEHILLKRIPVKVLLRVVGLSCKRQLQLVNEQWEKLFRYGIFFCAAAQSL